MATSGGGWSGGGRDGGVDVYRDPGQEEGDEGSIPSGAVEALAAEKYGRWFSFDDQKVMPDSSHESFRRNVCVRLMFPADEVIFLLIGPG